MTNSDSNNPSSASHTANPNLSIPPLILSSSNYHDGGNNNNIDKEASLLEETSQLQSSHNNNVAIRRRAAVSSAAVDALSSLSHHHQHATTDNTSTPTTNANTQQQDNNNNTNDDTIIIQPPKQQQKKQQRFRDDVMIMGNDDVTTNKRDPPVDLDLVNDREHAISRGKSQSQSQPQAADDDSSEDMPPIQQRHSREKPHLHGHNQHQNQNQSNASAHHHPFKQHHLHAPQPTTAPQSDTPSSGPSSLSYNSLDANLMTLIQNCSSRCIPYVSGQLWLTETNGIVSVRDPLRFGKVDGRPILWQNGQWKFNVHDVQQQYVWKMRQVVAERGASGASTAAADRKQSDLAFASDAAHRSLQHPFSQQQQQQHPSHHQTNASGSLREASIAYINQYCWDPVQHTVWMCATDGSIQIFNAHKKQDQNFRLLRVRIDGWQSHDGLITSIKYIPSRQVMVTCGLDAHIRFWNAQTFDLIHVGYLGGEWYLHSLEVDHRGFVWAASENGHLYVYRVKSHSEVHLLNDVNLISIKETTPSDEEMEYPAAYSKHHSNTRRNPTGICSLCFDREQHFMWAAAKNGFIYVVKTKHIQGSHLNERQLQKVVRRFRYPKEVANRGVIHDMLYIPRKMDSLIVMACTDTLLFFNSQNFKYIKSIRMDGGGFITSMTLIPRFVPQGGGTATLREYRITQEELANVRHRSNQEGFLIRLIARLWICQQDEVRELLLQEAHQPGSSVVTPHDALEKKMFYSETPVHRSDVLEETQDEKHSPIRQQSMSTGLAAHQQRQSMEEYSKTGGGIIEHDLQRDLTQAFPKDFDYLNRVVLRKADMYRNVKLDTSELYYVNDSWTQTKRSKRRRGVPVDSCSQTELTSNDAAIEELHAFSTFNAQQYKKRTLSLADKASYDLNGDESGVKQSAIMTTHVRSLQEVDPSEYKRLRTAYEKLLVEKEVALQNEAELRNTSQSSGCSVM